MNELPLEARLFIGLALAMTIVYAATPFAIRLATRLEFYDMPVGYKAHGAPTPYLGGLAVISGFVIAVLALTSDPRQTLPVVGGVIVLWAVGTLDDRRTVRPAPRVAVEAGLAALLWLTDLGWSLGVGPVVDLLATVVWVVAVVNAFNLFDNMDGASSAMASVVAAAVAALGLVQGDVWLVVTGAALCGACLGFLPHNLSRPSARIFLGDGGSMPVGFAVAALVMVGSSSVAGEWQALVLGLLLVGVPALDTCLVVISRRRRRVPILTAGLDHLTHRTHTRLRTARASVAALGAGQALLAVLAIVAAERGHGLLVPVVLVYLVAMAVLIAILDAEPRTVAAGSDLPESGTATRSPAKAEPVSGPVAWPALAVLALLGLALGLSPFEGGFYESSIWAPAGLGLIVVLTAALIAGPGRMARRAILGPAALAALAIWALLSATWTDSIEGAIVDGNRLLVYAAGLALLVVLLSAERGAVLAFGAFTLGAIAVGGWVLTGLLGGDETLFIGDRLSEPLGYINAQASFFVLALWPCVALAERRGSAPLAALGLAGATLFAGLAVLGQSRGAVLAAAVSAVIILALVPGRLRRAVALLVLFACLAPALPMLLSVYTDGATADRLQDAGLRVALCALAAGGIWMALVAAEQRAAAAGMRLRRAVTLGVAALAIVAGAAGLASAGRVGSFFDRQYTAFVTLGGARGEPTASRLATGAGNRHDYWRIATEAWRDRPLAGIGAGGYDKPYFANRKTTEDIRQPHSLALQILAELGIVGALLFAGALVAVLAEAWRRVRDLADGARAPLLVAALGVVTTWFVHTSVDWMHLLPGLTGVALLGAAVLLRPGRGDAPHATPRAVRSQAARVLPAVGIAVAIALTALSLSRQVLSERYLHRAQDAVAREPATALREADRALRIDRELIPAYYAKAAALARFGDGDGALAVLGDATRREPRNFVTWTLAGDLRVRRGEFDAARESYRRAARLNPRDAALARLADDPRAELGRR